MQGSIIGVIGIDMNDEYGLSKESLFIATEKGELARDIIFQHLKEEILKEGLAVHGIDATKKAVKNGQAELLLVEKDYKPRGWVCEHCQITDEGIVTTCPNCGNRTSEVDIIEEIIVLAERTDTIVEFTANQEIKGLRHVAALLRYK